MKQVPENKFSIDSSLRKNVIVDPVVRGFIRDWDAMEDLMCNVLYDRLGWKIGSEGQILFTDPLATPRVSEKLPFLVKQLDCIFKFGKFCALFLTTG